MGTAINNTEARSLLLRQQENLRQEASSNQNAIQKNSSDQQANGQAVQTNTQAQQGNASDVQTTTGNIQTTTQNIDAANAQKSGVNTEISNLQTELQSVQDDPDRASAIQGKLDAAEMSLSSLDAEIQQLETQKGQQEQELTGLEQTGTQLKSEGQTLEQDGTALQQTGADLAQKGADLDAHISDLDAQIAQAEAEEAQVADIPEAKEDGVYYDEESGMQIEVKDGKIVKTIELTDPDYAGSIKTTEFKDDVTVMTNTTDGEVTSRVAVSDNGNRAEYDGRGNTLLTVKAGESPDIIFNTFYGNSDKNADNRAALVERFRHDVRQKNGDPIASDYNPSDAELRQFFYQKSGFEVVYTQSDEQKAELAHELSYRGSVGNSKPLTSEETAAYYTREVQLKGGGIIQAGQTIKLPTEIHPDDSNLQNRDAAVERAKGNAAELALQARRDEEVVNTTLQQIEQDKEAATQENFRKALLQAVKKNAGVMDGETQRINDATSTFEGAREHGIPNWVDERMQEVIGNLPEDASLSDIASAVTVVTGGAGATPGALSVQATSARLNSLYNNMKALAKDPDNEQLRADVQNEWNEITMYNFVGQFNQSRVDDINSGEVIMMAMADMVMGVSTAPTEAADLVADCVTKGVVAWDTKVHYLSQGESNAKANLRALLSAIPMSNTLSLIMEPSVTSEVYDKLGDSTVACYKALSSLSYNEQQILAKNLEGKTDKQKAAIIAAYSKGSNINLQ